VSRFNLTLSTADKCFARGGGSWGRVSGWLLEHLVGYDAVVLNELFWLYRCTLCPALRSVRIDAGEDACAGCRARERMRARAQGVGVATCAVLTTRAPHCTPRGVRYGVEFSTPSTAPVEYSTCRVQHL
jgi:hypothetical protein